MARAHRRRRRLRRGVEGALEVLDPAALLWWVVTAPVRLLRALLSALG